MWLCTHCNHRSAGPQVHLKVFLCATKKAKLKPNRDVGRCKLADILFLSASFLDGSMVQHISQSNAGDWQVDMAMLPDSS